MSVITRHYRGAPFSMNEIFRYMGCKEKTESLENIVNECIDNVAPKLTYNVCFAEFSVKFYSYKIDLGFAETKSEALRRNLCGCQKLILFAATTGLEIDRLIARYSKTEPSRAVIFQAIGTERVESLADMFENDIKKEYGSMSFRPRFSPGYGDLELSLQKNIFETLGCYKRLGISLNENLLISPSKSITAIIGISNGK